MAGLAIALGYLWLLLGVVAGAIWAVLALQPFVQLPPVFHEITVGWGVVVLLILMTPGFWLIRSGLRRRRRLRAARAGR